MISAPSYLEALFQRMGGGMKFGLERTEKFMDYLGHPYREFRAVHVAGSNGKGSVTAVLAEIFRAHGESTGRFTSPHLLHFNERMRMNGDMIPEETVRRYLQVWDEYMQRSEISFFEISTGMAFRWFADMKAETAVIETGLGGRLDSTNVLDPALSVITRIAKDHTGILGATLKKIAAEKAGIIKQGRPVICCPQGRGVMQVLRDRAEEQKAPFYVSPSLKQVRDLEYRDHEMIFTTRFDGMRYRSRLIGEHQLENILLALTAAELKLGKKYDRELAAGALAEVQWAGRFERVSRDPLVIYDAGHNLNGAVKTLETLKTVYPAYRIRCVLGLLGDKDLVKIHRLFREQGAQILMCPVESHRSPTVGELQKMAADSREVCGRADEALELQLGSMDRAKDLLLVFGSHHLAEAVYRRFPSDRV